MSKLNTALAALGAAACLWAGVACADTPGIAVQLLSPGPSVMVNGRVTFAIVPSGFYPQSYVVSDSYTGTSVSSSDVDGGGHFWWVPIASDVGVHTLTVTARDNSGNAATLTQTLTVLPAPSVSISNISPGPSVMPGNVFSFTVTTAGFTNPVFSIGDAFNGSSASQVSIDAAGRFAWTPDLTQAGPHNITINTTDAQGHGASASVTVWVGAPASLLAQVTSTSTTVLPGQPVTMILSGAGFVPSNFSLLDSNPVSTVSNNNISSTGAFSWTPGANDFGYHTITFTGVVGNYGQSATTSKTIVVLGANGQMPPAPAAAPAATAAPAASITATAAAGAGGGYVFTKFLAVGYTGAEVTALQQKLTALGIYAGPVTGYFGPLTRAAVKTFQTKNGISPVGYVGPGTRAALNK